MSVSARPASCDPPHPNPFNPSSAQPEEKLARGNLQQLRACCDQLRHRPVVIVTRIAQSGLARLREEGRVCYVWRPRDCRRLFKEEVGQDSAKLATGSGCLGQTRSKDEESEIKSEAGPWPRPRPSLCVRTGGKRRGWIGQRSSSSSSSCLLLQPNLAGPGGGTEEEVTDRERSSRGRGVGRRQRPGRVALLSERARDDRIKERRKKERTRKKEGKKEGRSRTDRGGTS